MHEKSRNDNVFIIWILFQQALFNIKEDIGERNNLVSTEPETLDRLAKELSTYLKEGDAQLPALKKTGKQIPYPDEV